MLDVPLSKPCPGDAVDVKVQEGVVRGVLRAVNFARGTALVDITLNGKPQLFMTTIDNISIKERRLA